MVPSRPCERQCRNHDQRQVSSLCQQTAAAGISVDTKLIRITFPEEMQTDSFSVVAASGGQKPETTGDEPYFLKMPGCL